jgi:hypothetical protein
MAMALKGSADAAVGGRIRCVSSFWMTLHKSRVQEVVESESLSDWKKNLRPRPEVLPC